MDKRYVLIGGIVVLVGMLWQLGVFEGGPGEVPLRDPCGYATSEGFSSVRPALGTMRLQKEGIFKTEFITGVQKATINSLEVSYGSNYYRWEKGRISCNIKKPESDLVISSHEAFEVIANCPSIKKDADYAFLYITITYKAEGENKTRTSQGGLCLRNTGDGFS